MTVRLSKSNQLLNESLAHLQVSWNTETYFLPRSKGTPMKDMAFIDMNNESVRKVSHYVRMIGCIVDEYAQVRFWCNCHGD